MTSGYGSSKRCAQCKSPRRYILGLGVIDPQVAARVEARESEWLVALAPDGNRVAVLRDTSLEIYHLHHQYGQPIFSYNLPPDTAPAWRLLKWELSSNLLVAVTSGGMLTVIADDGRQWTTGCPLEQVPLPSHTAAASIAVLSEPRQLLVLGYDCTLRVYSLPSSGGSGLEPVAGLPDLRPYFGGTSAMAYSNKHQLVIMGGTPRRGRESNLVCWRRVSEAPYLEPFAVAGLTGTRSGSVCQLSCSPGASRLLALDTDNRVTIFAFPSLRVVTVWEYAEIQPAFVSSTRMQTADPALCHVHHATWWHDAAVLLAHADGALLVSTVDTFRNILGRYAGDFSR